MNDPRWPTGPHWETVLVTIWIMIGCVAVFLALLLMLAL